MPTTTATTIISNQGIVPPIPIMQETITHMEPIIIVCTATWTRVDMREIKKPIIEIPIYMKAIYIAITIIITK